MYRTSFNGIDQRTFGVYKLYGLTEQEVQIFTRQFNGRINGSGGDYTIYKDAKRYIFLKLYIHELNKPIQIDIRRKLLLLSGKVRIPKKLILGLEKNLSKTIYVTFKNGTWELSDPTILEKAVHASGY